MPPFDWFFKRGGNKPDEPGAPDAPGPTSFETAPSPRLAVPDAAGSASGKATVHLELPALCRLLAAALPALEKKTIQPDLVRARLADRFRDAGVEPMDPDKLLPLAEPLNRSEDAWRRLALVVEVLGAPELRAALPALLGPGPADRRVMEGFVFFALETRRLTLDVLRQSPLRLEELARRWVLRMEAGIAGEPGHGDPERLRRLNYELLLHEAEGAKLEAEQRQQEIKKLQRQQDMRTRRGQW